MTNFGLGYEALRRVNPDVIFASIPAYGASGPYATVPGIGGTIEPMSGLSSLLGYEGGRPQNSGAMYPDPVAGLYGVAAIILAPRHGKLTSERQTIDLAKMKALATFAGEALLQYAATGIVRPHFGNHHPRITPHSIYPAREGGWLALAAENEAAWRALARQIGHREWADALRFSSMAARKAHEQELDALITDWTREQDATAAAASLPSHGIAAVSVLNSLQVLAEPHLAARGFFVSVEHPEAGRWPHAGWPWWLSRTPACIRQPAPMPGEHSRKLLRCYARAGDEEYEQLIARGIAGDIPQ